MVVDADTSLDAWKRRSRGRSGSKVDKKRSRDGGWWMSEGAESKSQGIGSRDAGEVRSWVGTVDKERRTVRRYWVWVWSAQYLRLSRLEFGVLCTLCCRFSLLNQPAASPALARQTTKRTASCHRRRQFAGESWAGPVPQRLHLNCSNHRDKHWRGCDSRCARAMRSMHVLLIFWCSSTIDRDGLLNDIILLDCSPLIATLAPASLA